MNEKQIGEVIKLMSDCGSTILHDYAQWYVVASIGWIIFGAILIYAAKKLYDNREATGYCAHDLCAVAGVIAFIGLLFVFCNIPDLLSPRGIATQQIIKDFRGSK